MRDLAKLRAARKKWRDANKDRALAATAAWNAANPDKVKAYGRTYREANKQKRATVKAAWRAKNAERIKAKKLAYREANREKVRAYDKARRAARPELKRLSEQVRRARKAGAKGKLSPNIIATLMQRQRGLCGGCHEGLEKYHLDHVMPLALGGAHADENMQLLCPTCNMSKGGRHPALFAPRPEKTL